MQQTYDFLAPRKIVFGWGRRCEIGPLARSLGRRAFLVSGSTTLEKNGSIAEITTRLHDERLDVVSIETISREPQVDDVDRVTALLRDQKAGSGDMILAIGGGAAIDLAKAIAAMAVDGQSDSVLDYLEGVGRGLKPKNEPLPIVAMPTTAGTGTEATKNAVIASFDPPFKKSLRDERLVPRIALIDPELTVSVPPGITATTGLDAITQLFESFLSKKNQPIPRALAVQGLQWAIPALPEAVDDGASREAREKMAHAALLSGMCLANSGLGLAHGVAPALGVHFHVPHGTACAIMLPLALRVNRPVCEKEMAQLAHLLFGRVSPPSQDEAIDFLIDQIETLCNRIGVPRRLSEVGVTADRIPDLARDSRGSSMSGNPRELSDDELVHLLEDIL